MKMKLLALLAAGLLAGPAAASDAATADVEKATQALNDAFKTGDPEVIRQRMTDDHQAVTPWAGQQTRAEQIKTLPELKLTEYAPGKLTVRMLGRDAALVTYPLAMTGTFRGKKLPAASFASAVWVKQDGKWLEAYYQETAAGK